MSLIRDCVGHQWQWLPMNVFYQLLENITQTRACGI